MASEHFASDELDKRRHADNPVRMEARLTKLETEREHDRLALRAMEQRLGDTMNTIRSESRDEALLLRAELTQFRSELRGDYHALRTELGDLGKRLHTHFLWYMGIQAGLTFALLGLGAKALHLY